MNLTLKKRIKSLLWRIGMMAAVVAVDQIAQNLGLFNIGPALTGIIGLTLGEVSKFINSNVPILKGRKA